MFSTKEIELLEECFDYLSQNFTFTLTAPSIFDFYLFL